MARLLFIDVDEIAFLEGQALNVISDLELALRNEFENEADVYEDFDLLV